jgi:hypothetical protein
MTTRSNGVSFKWLLGVAGTIIILLLGALSYLARADIGDQKATVKDHERRIQHLEQIAVRRDEQYLNILKSLERMEEAMGTLPAVDSLHR